MKQLKFRREKDKKHLIQMQKPTRHKTQLHSSGKKMNLSDYQLKFRREDQCLVGLSIQPLVGYLNIT